MLHQDTGACLKHASCGIPKEPDTVGRREVGGGNRGHDSVEETEAGTVVK